MEESPQTIDSFVDSLNREYAALHTKKEDAFWRSYMGLDEDKKVARSKLDDASIELDRWLQDTDRPARVARCLASEITISDESRTALEGWSKTFEANGIANAEGRRLSEEIFGLESKLAASRGGMELGYRVAGRDFTKASSIELGGMLRSDPDPARRQAAWEGLRSIETHVVQNGFLDVVRERNRLGKLLGGEDYYDWRVRRSEGMSKAEIFELLDELEARTRDAGERALADLRKVHGAEVKPWNISFLVAGDSTRESDPYFPFSLSLRRWVRSFAGLGADYRGARLVLDLLDRPGKYENGFCHGPEVAWRDRGIWKPARVHFTATAIPTQIGAGHRSLETLFHEGGHAIHFANVDMPAPCYAQENAPTSIAYAEIQSMLLDGIIGDADWMRLYATDRSGSPIPFSVIERSVSSKQPFAAWFLRQMMVVPYTERAIYELPEHELTAERVLRVCRETEARILGLAEGSPRPVLSIPHLLSRESSAYYHGYVLAEMGVYQTRSYLLGRDGRITDNHTVCPSLRDSYWQPGNRYTLHQHLERMTGERLTPRFIAEEVNQTTESAVRKARELFRSVEGKSAYDGPADINASIAIVHGNERIADSTDQSIEECFGRFERWIEAK